MPVRVLIADDSTLFREGLASLLNRRDGIEVTGLAKDAVEAVRKAVVLRPDVVLMDLAMPRGGGLAATRMILAERPEQTICVLTISGQPADLFAAIEAGARGYLLKTVPLEDLCRALVALAHGGSVISPQLAVRLLREFARLTPAPKPASAETASLSAREREVLELVAQGASNKEIAARLVIGENTVKVHLRNILDKLHLRNRQQAAAFAAESGLIRRMDMRLRSAPVRLAAAR